MQVVPVFLLLDLVSFFFCFCKKIFNFSAAFLLFGLFILTDSLNFPAFLSYGHKKIIVNDDEVDEDEYDSYGDEDGEEEDIGI